MAKLYSYRPSLSLNRDKNTCLKRHVSTGIADADAGTRAHLVQYMKLIIQTDNSFLFLSKKCVTYLVVPNNCTVPSKYFQIYFYSG